MRTRRFIVGLLPALLLAIPWTYGAVAPPAPPGRSSVDLGGLDGETLKEMERRKKPLPSMVILWPERLDSVDSSRGLFDWDRESVRLMLQEELKLAFGQRFRILLAVEGPDATQLGKTAREKRFGRHADPEVAAAMDTAEYTMVSRVAVSTQDGRANPSFKGALAETLLDTLGGRRRGDRFEQWQRIVAARVSLAITKGREALLQGDGSGAAGVRWMQDARHHRRDDDVPDDVVRLALRRAIQGAVREMDSEANPSGSAPSPR